MPVPAPTEHYVPFPGRQEPIQRGVGGVVSKRDSDNERGEAEKGEQEARGLEIPGGYVCTPNDG